MASSKSRSNSKSGTTRDNIDCAVSSTGTGTQSCPESTAPESKLDPQQRLIELTNNFAFAQFFSLPDDMEQALQELYTDLSEVPVIDIDGQVTDPHLKLERDTKLTASDKLLIWQSLAVVRQAFYRADGTANGGGYQWNMNWKHTRAEIDQVYEAARLLDLSAEETRDAVLASIFSDAVKNRRNFITHNIDGAYGAAQVLHNFVDTNDAGSIEMIERVSQAVRQHQIAPPEFMARAIAIMLAKKLRIPKFDVRTLQLAANTGVEVDDTKQEIASVYRKVADPFNPEHLVQDRRRILFTKDEQELLAQIGVVDWFVPHPSNQDARIAHAVIAGDHSINYNHPEGFAKIALIRGPDTEAIFEDPTVHDSLESAVSSFADSFRVLLPEVQPMAINGLRRTQIAVERVMAVMRELFSGVVIGPVDTNTTGEEKVAAAIERAHSRKPELFILNDDRSFEACQLYTEKAVARVGMILQRWLDEWGEIPYTPKSEVQSEPGSAKLPFWNAPLRYPERDMEGRLNFETISEFERRQFQFAVNIRDIAVELLRAEQWIYCSVSY